MSIGGAVASMIKFCQRQAPRVVRSSRLLLLGDGDRGEECFFGRRCVRRIALKENFAADAMQEGVAPVFSSFAPQAPSASSMRAMALQLRPCASISASRPWRGTAPLGPWFVNALSAPLKLGQRQSSGRPALRVPKQGISAHMRRRARALFLAELTSDSIRGGQASASPHSDFEHSFELIDGCRGWDMSGFKGTRDRLFD